MLMPQHSDHHHTDWARGLSCYGESSVQTPHSIAWCQRSPLANHFCMHPTAVRAAAPSSPASTLIQRADGIDEPELGSSRRERHLARILGSDGTSSCSASNTRLRGNERLTPTSRRQRAAYPMTVIRVADLATSFLTERGSSVIIHHFMRAWGPLKYTDHDEAMNR